MAMNYLGRVGKAGARLVSSGLSSCKDLYNDLNAANLTGAVDVVVVKQRDGLLSSTPFHVRFGKLGVLRTGDLQKEVDIEVNGQPVDSKMMLDESGHAFFAKLKSTSEVKVTSSTSSESNINRESSDTSVNSGTPEKDRDEGSGKFEGERARSGSGASEGQEEEDECPVGISLGVGHPPASKPMDIERSWSNGHMTRSYGDTKWGQNHTTMDSDDGIFSDSALDSPELNGGSRSLPANIGAGIHSDSEMEISIRRMQTKGETTQCSSTTTSRREEPTALHQNRAVVDRQGFWGALTGMLRKKRRRFSNVEDGIYLDDLDQANLHSHEVNKFFPAPNPLVAVTLPEHTTPSTLVSSGVDTMSSPSVSPARPSSPWGTSPLDDRDVDKVVTQLSDIAMSTCGGLAEGTLSEELFENFQLSFDDFSQDPSVFSNPDLVIRIAGRYYNWPVAAPMVMCALCYHQQLPDSAQNKLEKSYMPKKSQPSFWNFWKGRPENPRTHEDQLDGKTKSAGATPRSGTPQRWVGPENLSSDEGQTDEEIGTHKTTAVRGTRRSLRKKKFNLTLVPPSDELLKWPLKPGANELVFSITTKYQGTTKTSCSLYLWNYNDKIVISDIDGTITKSDVAGQVLPWFGKDWTQNGVTELFNAITRNGYHILYLSARAIGQSSYTKDFLRRVHKGQYFLPDGPLMLVPSSMYTAFKKEVIDRNPEEFKIDCLKQIRQLFPADHNPYHAGFGNKPSDAKSYQQVDVPVSRVYIVNYQGDLKNQLTWTFHSSYAGLQEWVDAQFSPFTDEPDCAPAPPTREEFTSFNYWRDSSYFASVDLPDLA